MQGKGIIRAFAILLAVVCILQYFFWWKTSSVENKAEDYATEVASNYEGEEQKLEFRNARIAYLDSISSETVLTIPLVKDYTYNELKSSTLNLGLDLKGGMSAVLEVNVRELIEQLANNSKDPQFVEALDAADAEKSSSQSDYVTLFADNYLDNDNAKKLSSLFAINSSLSSDINAESSNAEVIQILRERANSTVTLTYEMLKERIDKLGVVQPNVTLDANRDLILVELPGIENPERAETFLKQTAKLEFWNTYRITDPGIGAALAELDRIISVSSQMNGDGLDEELQTTWEFKYDSITGEVIDSIEVEATAENAPIDANELIMINNPNAPIYMTTSMGLATANNRDEVEEYLAKDDVKTLFPPDIFFRWGKESITLSDGDDEQYYVLYALKSENTDGSPLLEGSVITGADANPDPLSGEMTVSLNMNNEGRSIWGDMTTKAANAGNREVAITLDDEVVTAPSVNQPITTGSSSITGNFNVQEANDLAKILEIGKLPATIKIIQQATVGPSLGAKNIQRSVRSLILGLGLVLIFMALYYGGAGIVSIIALLLNIFFIFGALASFGTVLTLPGIAGIILTIGMAVDANVIIYERVREELRSGKTLLASIADGFKFSYSAIIDANVTTLIVALILSYFGLGPIKGFAVVLIIGVLMSVFTAVLLGKMMIDWYTKGSGRNMSFWTPPFRNAFANLSIDWVGKRKIAYVVSGVLIAAGLVSLFTSGLDLGVDFKGGYSYTIEFDENVDIDAATLRTGLAESFGSTPVVKSVNAENTFNITTDYLINDPSDGADSLVVNKLVEGLGLITGTTIDKKAFKDESGIGTHMISSAKVGPTIADDIKRSSYLAALIALVFIFAYIFIRFSKWQYSLGAVSALFHDTLILLGVFSLLKNVLPLEIDQAFIAALLTVIGYSINDTVVVFDRIREYLGIYTSKTTDEVLNLAINSTFSRTLITSLTTLFVVLMLFIFGSGSIKAFAFALLVGVFVGTYSSIFVATPILRDFSKDLRPKVNTSASGKKSYAKSI